MTPIQRAATLQELFQAGVDAVGGRQATQRSLEHHDLLEHVHLVAVGKAADAMATGALPVIGDRLVSGLVITKHDHLSVELKAHAKLRCLEAGHPVPDNGSLLAGKTLSEFVGQIPADHQLVFLVSGGTSALVEHLNNGLDLSDLTRETDKLLASGAPIGEMNRHRRSLSQIKGGKLASRVNCQVLQLLISDVPGDKPGDIGSGLLIPDAATGMRSDLPVWNRITTQIIASSSIAQAAVERAALNSGLTVCQPAGNLNGHMPEVIDHLESVLSAPNLSSGVYIWGGEPTVVLPDNPGRGGRNQHLALALSKKLALLTGVSLLVCGTDGTDGPTADAGGLVDEQTCHAAEAAELDIDDYLLRADAGNCLEPLSCLVTTGPTGTNVMDLAIAIVE